MAESVDDWFPLPPVKRKKLSSTSESSDPEMVEQIISGGIYIYSCVYTVLRGGVLCLCVASW